MYNFEHRLLAELKKNKVPHGGELYVAVSGGADSMALLYGLERWKKVLKADLKVIYVHHGITKNKKLLHFRNKSWVWIQKFCKRHQMDFVSNLSSLKKQKGKLKYEFLLKPDQILKSESELRDFRYFCFQKLSKPNGIIVLAHHKEDLLETRLLQMIRGAGVQGVQSLNIFQNNLYRPLLNLSKKQILQYCKQRKIKFLEDPSNLDGDPLRNWVRNTWLPLLEEKRPGGVKNLSDSLSLMVENLQHSHLDFNKIIQNQEILYPSFLTLSRDEKKQVLARYMNQLGLKDYSQSHIHEILKRLDSDQLALNFSMLKCNWIKDAQRIKAMPNSGSKGTK